MDTEDRDHFKTIAKARAELLPDLQKKPTAESSNLVRDPAYCLRRAEILFGCYRKDEVNDPEIYCSAVAAVLSEYPQKVIDTVTDPRSGLPSDIKWLPNVAEVRSACSQAARRMAMLSEPKRVAVEFVPPPVKAGQVTWGQYNKLVAEGKTPMRPIGAFEKDGYLGPSS